MRKCTGLNHTLLASASVKAGFWEKSALLPTASSAIR
jgi:hypothetical protein